MSKQQDQDNARRARAREIGLFRYGLIQDALSQELSAKQPGRLVLAAAGYRPLSIVNQLRLLAHVSRWTESHNYAVTDLTVEVLEE